MSFDKSVSMLLAISVCQGAYTVFTLPICLALSLPQDPTRPFEQQCEADACDAGDPVDRRAIEFSMRPRAAENLQQTAHSFASQASSSDPKFSHIPAADKQKVSLSQQTLLHWMISFEQVSLDSIMSWLGDLWTLGQVQQASFLFTSFVNSTALCAVSVVNADLLLVKQMLV